jgi:hypothetical protein
MCRFQDEIPIHISAPAAGKTARSNPCENGKDYFFLVTDVPKGIAGDMLFLRLACMVLMLFSLSPAEELQTKAEPCPKDADWCRLERESQFPSCFPPPFVDSLQTVKGVVPAPSRRTLARKPFAKGEKFVFDARWGPITAGYVILTAAPDSSAADRLIITGKGMTNGFFSSMYKVRDYIRATLDVNGIYPLFFEQHIREGRYRADRWEMFDQDKTTVYTHKKDADSVAAPPFVQNYFSMIYWIRSLTFAPGDSFSFDCFVDKKSYRLILTCQKRGNVTTDAGSFNCLLVKPLLVGEGRVFTKKDEILLWFTDDEFKMPVMAKAKIKFGSITARLIWYERER